METGVIRTVAVAVEVAHVDHREGVVVEDVVVEIDSASPNPQHSKPSRETRRKRK
ncbi:MAG TPA: hypothetical protein VNT20_20395 [Flavisolibacter sp.]|nr:hypothetical protein [Flavisolibacter sp.]